MQLFIHSRNFIMNYQAEKVQFIDTSPGNTIVQTTKALAAPAEVSRTRKRLILLITISLVFNTLFFIQQVYRVSTQYANGTNSAVILIPAILCLLYNCFGLVVTYKYHQTGILIFAWLGVINFIILCAIVLKFQYAFKLVRLIKNPTAFETGLF
ncbi:unnamed protein product [Didymodactylos carnosus]|uniref:Uncharacterized protein n=1 Tax=Didymodactylos carnosus TaxID=1234261 RepID=A0A814PGJ3_9BILA|nr:unnamed protein product [Didymodactylos carnosus]CAF1105698.1 unnamed protein product [Didymodactylos carnosus]CAF3573882.1 unnamed protein product [Didymodactylos carnosus]CAF3870321.1 unnamed protein product [Didymodactylos carnosus]